MSCRRWGKSLLEMGEIPPYRHFKLAQPSAELPNTHSIHPTPSRHQMSQYHIPYLYNTGVTNTMWDEMEDRGGGCLNRRQLYLE